MFRWLSKCKLSEPGKINILNKQRYGRPVTITNKNQRIQMDELIKNDRWIIQNRILLNPSYQSHNLLLGYHKKKLSSLFSNLAIEKCAPIDYRKCWRRKIKKKRVECCQKLLTRYHQEWEQFLFEIMTSDENWAYHSRFRREKRQSMEYRNVTSL